MNISVKINITIALLLLGEDPFATPVTDKTGQRVREAETPIKLCNKH